MLSCELLLKFTVHPNRRQLLCDCSLPRCVARQDNHNTAPLAVSAVLYIPPFYTHTLCMPLERLFFHNNNSSKIKMQHND